MLFILHRVMCVYVLVLCDTVFNYKNNLSIFFVFVYRNRDGKVLDKHIYLVLEILARYTSNVTGRHQGQKRKLRAASSAWLQSADTKTDVMLRCVIIIQCDIARFLCAIRVFEVRALSSSPSLPLCQISFILRPPLLS